VALFRRNLNFLAVPGDGLERLRCKDCDIRGLVEISLEVELSVLYGGVADEIRSMNQN
jgi:hypothetical protein